MPAASVMSRLLSPMPSRTALCIALISNGTSERRRGPSPTRLLMKTRLGGLGIKRSLATAALSDAHD